MTNREALDSWMERSQAVLDEYEEKTAEIAPKVAQVAIREFQTPVVTEITAHSPNFYA